MKGLQSRPWIFFLLCLLSLLSACLPNKKLTVVATALLLEEDLGIIFLANLQIGALTPPVGMSLFISSLRFEQPMSRIIMASLPFIAVLLFVLAIITYIPWLSLALLK